MTGPGEGLDEWRRRIDALDLQLVDLLNRRLECSVAIGAVKRTRGLAVRDPRREEEVVARLGGLSQGPLTPQALGRIYEVLFEESRRIQEES